MSDEAWFASLLSSIPSALTASAHKSHTSSPVPPRIPIHKSYVMSGTLTHSRVATTNDQEEQHPNGHKRNAKWQCKHRPRFINWFHGGSRRYRK